MIQDTYFYFEHVTKALAIIADGAIVSLDQTPEKITEQVLRVLQLVREDCVKSLEVIGIQQKRAEGAEAALEAIRKTAQRILAETDIPTRTRSDWRAVSRHTDAAIAAVKGENSDEDELV